VRRPANFSIHFRFLFAMMSGWEMLELASSHSSIPPVFGTVEVAAESLYEAAALAVREFRRHPWVDDVEPGIVTPLSISVKPPATTHEVSIKQLERWAASTPKSPREFAQKSRVRELLQQKG
jgi:hypothetical protein